ncbi:hypothetical protein EMIT047CA2_200071 [Pseudomonas soli]
MAPGALCAPFAAVRRHDKPAPTLAVPTRSLWAKHGERGTKRAHPTLPRNRARLRLKIAK